MLPSRLHLPVLFFYDYVITLSQEVDVIWRRKWTATTWLYLLTRYSTIVDQIIVLIPPWNSSVSSAYQAFLRTSADVRFPRRVFSALRVYALSDGRYLIAGLVFLLNLVPVATNMVNFITSTVFEDSEICTVDSQLSDKLIISCTCGCLNQRSCIDFEAVIVSLTTRIAVIVGDVLVLAVTWMKTARVYREARRLNLKSPLVTMILRDGTLYFRILLVIYILEILENNIPAMFTLNIIQPFYVIIPPLIICRFLLNLRQVDLGLEESSLVSGRQSHSVRFVGNIGESLQFGGDDNEDDGDGEDGYELDEYYTQTDLSPASAGDDVKAYGEDVRHNESIELEA
ncbi:hypothetical protein BC629DRAFT_1680760 [Irpex lacteus]|nr:hypothetical protein BC629DRAFT_1680760 [Irpex lacteus]